MAKSRHDRADKGKRTPSREGTSKPEVEDDLIPQQLQQHVLNIFRDALLQDDDQDLKPVIQKVKQHLYDRDFASAFGSEQNLLAYAARWSSYRALGYLQVFQDISSFVAESNRPAIEDLKPSALLIESSKQPNGNAQSTGISASDGLADASSKLSLDDKSRRAEFPPAYDTESSVPAYENPPAYGMNTGLEKPAEKVSRASMTITFLGGGAGAELVASAAWLRLQTELAAESSPSVFGQTTIEGNSLEVHCIDIADWSDVVRRLSKTVETAPTISKYASAAIKAANLPLLPPDAMRSDFEQQDVLEASPDYVRALFQRSDLITIMFTLNELYSTSVSKTQRLLFEMTVAASPGTLLLVVDSPGSYSTVRLNDTEKKYPMQWLLDHTLLEASKNTRVLPRGDQWEKLLTDESRWFRPPKDLRYPIELENMRYQIHLYRRLAVPDDPTRPEPSVTKPQR